MRTANLLRNASLLLVCSTFIALSGCEEDPAQPASKARTINGETKTVGSGTATSWLKLGEDGKPTSVGITLSDSALMGLPTNPFPPTEYAFTLPAEAATTAYDHITLDWNSQGHEPDSIYTLPHFDVHFYHITQAQRNDINPADTAKVNKMPGAEYIPTGYFTPPPPAAIPRMGVHWVDPTSGEFHHQTFNKTLIYGYWDGNMIFTEPMITVAYLQSNPNFTENLKLPQKYAESGVYYATKYSIKRDAAKKEYIISLDGLTMR